MKMENFLLTKNVNVDIVYKWTFCTTFKSLRQFQLALDPNRPLNQGLRNRALKMMSHLFNDKAILLSKMRCKDYYLLFQQQQKKNRNNNYSREHVVQARGPQPWAPVQV